MASDLGLLVVCSLTDHPCLLACAFVLFVWFACYCYAGGSLSWGLTWGIGMCVHLCLSPAEGWPSMKGGRRMGVRLSSTATCVECGRRFDLLDESDAEEWHYGHDCEPVAVTREWTVSDWSRMFGACGLRVAR